MATAHLFQAEQALLLAKRNLRPEDSGQTQIDERLQSIRTVLYGSVMDSASPMDGLIQPRTE